MFFSIWLGIILSGGQSGCTTLHHHSGTTPVAYAPSPEPRHGAAVAPTGPSAPVRGLRNVDSSQVPKVPPPGAKAVYNSIHINEPYIALTFDDGPHVTNT
ncbi:MAG: polysaccharide deacetylase family protein, partial [Verrucomicrobiaceae bacterium]